MPDIADELKTYLKTKTAVTDLIGAGVAAKIYKDNPKQGIALPYISFEVFEDIDYEALAEIVGIVSARFQIDCYGATSSAAWTLAEAVRLAPLQMYRGLMGTTMVKNVSAVDGFNQGIEPPVKGGNQRRYWVSRDYILTFEQAVTA